MAFGRKTTPKPAKTTDPRAELVHALADSGTAVASACGTCGATVATDDPQGEQTTRQAGAYPYTRQVRSWRYHGVCSRAVRGPELLALVLDPDARPVRVTQAHADVARTLGVPLAYRELEDSAATDAGRGRHRFKHVPKVELEELRAAVDKRRQELTVPVPHASGYPCGVCGRSHELVDAWGTFEGRPVCGPCSRMVKRSSPRIPGNQRLTEVALDAARPSIPPNRDLNRFSIARDADSYRPLSPEERREPWAYVAGLPEWPLTDEERMAARLAEVEARLAGVAA